MNHRRISNFKVDLDQRGTGHHVLNFIIFCLLIFAVIGTFRAVSSHAEARATTIKSGIAGQCLDDHDSKDKAGSIVDAWGCNGSSAQGWTLTDTTLKNEDGLCLDVAGSSNSPNSPVVLNTCDNSPGEVWLYGNKQLFNPNAKMCLSEPAGQKSAQLMMSGCKPTNPNNTWDFNFTYICDSGSEGEKVACNAEKQWAIWQTGTPSHETLLTTYTDGAPYEEWCADFVSYIYKEAGYPFTNGEANGWDESNANNVQNQGFTIQNSPNYIPQVGDVAYFDYEGGHVEIVISGGKHPSFIYGNSATIDPTTGNGEMESNTITQDGTLGNLVYYMSPS